MPSRWARRLALPALVLVLALAVSALFVRAADDAEQAQHQLQAARQADEVEAAIEARMGAYFQVLRGAQAFHAASAPLSRHEWRTYVDRLDLQETHPGIEGVGFVAWVWPQDVPRFEVAARSDGALGFDIRPEPMPGEVVAPVLYLAVPRGGPSAAVGMDLFASPAHRAALERAAMTGQAALTEPVDLLSNGTDEPGYLMVLPLYRGGVTNTTDWRNQTEGWVAAAFQGRDVAAVLVRDDLGVGFAVHDGGLLLHEAQGGEGRRPIVEARAMEFGGRTWNLTVHNAFGSRLGPLSTTVLTAGILSSLLVASITWSLASTRERAERRAADITRDLYVKEARFRALADTANDAIINADSAGRVVYVNAAIEKTLGWKPDELLGQELTVLMPPAARPLHRAGLARVVQGGPSRILGKTIALTALHRDGREVPVELSLSTWTAPEGRYFSGILRDMTERRAQELALHDRETRLMEAQAIANLGSWQTDLATGRSRWSDQLWRIHGLEPQPEISVAQASRLIHPDDLPAAEAETRRAIAAGTPFQYEVRILRPDGTTRWIEVRGGLLVADGQPVGLRGTSQDITERKAAEAARQVAEERRLEIQRLEEANRFRAHFLNVSAHELATPLTPLRLQVQLLQMAEQERPLVEFQRNVAIVSRGVERLARLIRDILDSARIQAGRFSIAPAPLDLTAAAREALDSFQDAAHLANIRMRLDAAGPVEVEGDATRLAQVLDNLLSNALKFTPDGGAITVQVEGGADEATVRVTDSGIGMTARQRGRLFQPFTQVHDPEQARERGTGLGLYISKGIVERHGGRMAVDSPGPGHGTTFWFTLLRKQPPRPPEDD
ncbi:MAG: hypothetical protein QOD77_1982 [Thermoplasmata archaeon]|nr:hypothetical protein [Thermoplasmata archaeon]